MGFHSLSNSPQDTVISTCNIYLVKIQNLKKEEIIIDKARDAGIVKNRMLVTTSPV